MTIEDIMDHLSKGGQIFREAGKRGGSMNLYELEKKATPGPCKVGKYEPDPELQVLTRGWMQGGRCIVDFINPDDAAMFAHCRNHFMEALEMLKADCARINGQEQQRYAASGCDMDYRETKHLKQLKALIAKLENVRD